MVKFWVHLSQLKRVKQGHYLRATKASLRRSAALRAKKNFQRAPFFPGTEKRNVNHALLPSRSLSTAENARPVPSGRAAATSPRPRTAVQTLVYISLLEILLRLDSEDFGWIGLLPIKIIVGITTRCSILQEPHKQAFSHARSVS